MSEDNQSVPETPATAPEPPAWNPSADQQSAREEILSWVKQPNKSVLTLGGLAGVGKTVLIGQVARELMADDLDIAFVTPTGKAAQVLQRSLRNAGVEGDVTTIHSLLYRPVEDRKTGRVIGWSKREDASADLIIIDEASMVAQDVLQDLMALKKPILAVGDHGQLSPVGEDAGLMRNPDLRLEKIHRQAKGNPIIRLAHMVRNGAPDDVIKDFITDIDDERVRWTRSWDAAVEFAKPPGLVLTHTNKLRRLMNIRMREHFGHDEYDDPKLGETVICLKNKRLEEGRLLANGMRGVIASEPQVSEHHVIANVQFDEPVGLVEKLFMCRHQFLREKTFAGFVDVPGEHWGWPSVGALMDFGSALTVHKSVVEDTLICPVGQKPKMIKDFVAGDVVKGIGPAGDIVDTRVVALHDHGNLMAFEVEFDDGFTVTCTENHKFLTDEGQKPIKDIVNRRLEVLCVNKEKERWLDSSVWPELSVSKTNVQAQGKMRAVPPTSAAGKQPAQDSREGREVRASSTDEESSASSSFLFYVQEPDGAQAPERGVEDSLRIRVSTSGRRVTARKDMQNVHRPCSCVNRAENEAVKRTECHSGGESEVRGGMEGSSFSTRSARSSQESLEELDSETSGVLRQELPEGSFRKKKEVDGREPRGGEEESRAWHSRVKKVGKGASRRTREEVRACQIEWCGGSDFEEMEAREPRGVQNHLDEDAISEQAEVTPGVVAKRKRYCQLARRASPVWRYSKTGRLRIGQRLDRSRRLLALLQSQRHSGSKSKASLHTGARCHVKRRSEETGRVLDTPSIELLLDTNRTATVALAAMAQEYAPVSDTRSLVRRRVVRIHPLGLRRMYDLEVSHEQHNFLLPNGIVTSNSQGSSAPSVAVFMERSLAVLTEDEQKRWKYTALTRAVDKALLIF